MNAKHLTSLSVENFRGFRRLELREFAAVNLVVGQNNAGKTSFLEAIAALVAPNQIDEHSTQLHLVSHAGRDRNLRWLLADGSEEATLRGSLDGGAAKVSIFRKSSTADKEPGQKTFTVGEWRGTSLQPDGTKHKVRIISLQAAAAETMVARFADAVRPPKQQRMLEALLAAVDPRIRDARLDVDPRGTFIAMDLGLSERLPLSQAGQGIHRLVEIFADLLGAPPTICLIDEIETGLHHTALRQMWTGIAEVSSALGIQVFATTHSQECLEAARRVFVDEDPENEKDFAVIQLMRIESGIVGKVLNEHRIEAALENAIELR